MFCVIYEFYLDEANEDEFKTIWRQVTINIKNQDGLGSRLHKALNKPNCWVAYAQWPSKDKWDNQAPLNVTDHGNLISRMREICTDIKTIYELEMVDDLLVKDFDAINIK